jgi:hypothetical protein
MSFRYVRLIVCNECRRYLLIECSAKCNKGRAIARVADGWCMEEITPTTVILCVHFIECTNAKCQRLTVSQSSVAVRTAELVEKHGVLITHVLQNIGNVLILSFGMEFTICSPALPARDVVYKIPSALFSISDVGMPYETVVEPITHFTDLTCELELRFYIFTPEKGAISRRDATLEFFDCVAIWNGNVNRGWIVSDYVAWCIREQKESIAKRFLCDAYEKRVEEENEPFRGKECCDTGWRPCYSVRFCRGDVQKKWRFTLQDRGFCLKRKQFYDCSWNKGKVVVARCKRSFICLSNGLSYVWRETETQCYWTEAISVQDCG